MASPLSESCANHPDRRGFAVCMSCRKVVCQECATTWNGVNHCRSCLAAIGAAAASGRRARAWIAWAASCGLLFVAAGYALAWSTALLARLW
ncbi:MAG TPA: hypothetical protein VFA79_07355 [Myxococcales bacterium]|nr:hypothetical protein [Myxococcales bacterium]